MVAQRLTNLQASRNQTAHQVCQSPSIHTLLWNTVRSTTELYCCVFVQWTLYHRAFLLWIFYRRPFFCGFRLSISLLSHHAVYTLPLWIQTQHLLAEPFGRLRIWAQHLLAESFGRCRFRLIISLLSHCVI